MGALTAAECDCIGTLVIGSIDFSTPAWCPVDLSDLWRGRTLRGSDRIVPGSDGAVRYDRVMTLARHTVPMMFVGDYSSAGVLQSDAGDGLYANIAAFKAGCCITGALTGTFTPPGAAALTATVTYESFEARVQIVQETSSGRFRAIALATYDFSIPAGLFT